MTDKEREHLCFAKLQQLRNGSVDWLFTFKAIFLAGYLVADKVPYQNGDAAFDSWLKED